MPARKLTAVIVFAAITGLCSAAWAQAGQPVMYLTVGLVQDRNIVKVMWEPQRGVTGYTVERWEAWGTNFWHYNINNTMKSGDTRLKIGDLELDPFVFSHPANSGEYIELYDENVKSSHTYFYRVNRGNIYVAETKSRPVVSQGNSEKKGEEQNKDDQGGDKKTITWRDRAKDEGKSADYPERMAADLIMAVPNWLIKVTGLYDPLELVFDIDLKDSYRPREDSGKNKELIWGVFSVKEFAVISDFYSHAKEAAPVFMVVAVVIAGALSLFSSTSAGSTDRVRGYITGVLLCALLLKLGPYLLGFFFDVNRAVVALCYGVIADEVHQSILHTIYNEETRSLGSAFMALIACLSVGVINFQFAVRKVFIAILIGILPIALINAIYPGRRNVLTVWVREFASYVFMPAGFAVGLAFFIRFLYSGDFWVTLVCLLTLPTINSLVRGALGLSDGGFVAGIGSALGMGAFFSLGGMLKSGGGEKGGPSGAAGGSAGGAQGGAGVKGVTGTQMKGGSFPASGRGAPGVAGYLARGAVGLGVTGFAAAAGSILSGAATGESGTGLQTGLNIGKSASRAVNNSGTSVKQFVSEAREKGLAGASGIVDNSMLLDPGVTASLARRVLGDNVIGNTAAATAATASMVSRAIAPLAAPEARERLDKAIEFTASAQYQKHSTHEEQTASLSKEFDKIRQAQNYRQMFNRIKGAQHSGGSGGADSCWR